MTRRRWIAPFGALMAAVVAASLGAQATTLPTTAPEIDSGRGSVAVSDPPPPVNANLDVPFSVGERATYDVKFGFVHVGTGTMTVANVQTLRGRDVWHTVFDIKGGTLFYHVNDTLESWFDVNTLSSMRFLQRLDEGGRIRNRNYEIFPDSSVFVLNRKPPEPSVPNPLDDGSFLFFVRTLPLNVGETYTFPRYFNPKANPVTIKVVRKERIQVPAGTFQAVVVQPIIKTAGIFGKDGHAEVWFSDDSQHIVLQMKSKMSIGSLDMFLRSFQPGRGAAASVSSGAAPDSAVLPPEPPPPAHAGKPDKADSASTP